MRIRNVLTALTAAVALVGLSAAPAAAGTGASQACTDGIGYLGTGLSNPVTVSFELSYAPTSTGLQQVWVCYSTTATGQPNAIVGGAIRLDVVTNTGTTYPGAGVGLYCLPDSGVSVGPITCMAGTGANTAPFDVRSTPRGATCLVAVNGLCAYYLPGEAVYTNATPYPLLGIYLVTDRTGWVPIPGVDLPPHCVAILTTC